MPPINFGIGLSLSKIVQISKFGITGTAYPGSILVARDLSGLLLLMDDGEILADDGEKLANGVAENYYQWYINDVPILGANDYIFVVPETVNDGDRIRVNDSFTVVVQSLPFAVVSAEYTVAPRATNTPTPSQVTLNDKIVSRITGAITVTDYTFSSTLQGVGDNEYWTFVSSNPTIGSVNSSTGYVTYQSPGVTTITATLRTETRTFNLTTSTQTGQTVDTFISYVNGSLAKYASDAVDNRIANKFNASTNLRIYTSQNHTTAAYVRNTNLWCSDIDLTCISPWNSSGTTAKACTLISPRHVIMAAHWAATAGSTVRFVTMDNQVVVRTITATRRHPSYSPYYPDISIGVLNNDVPANIKFAKVLPPTWPTYLPSISDTSAVIPAIGLDKDEKATIRDLRIIGNEYTSFIAPTNSKRLALYEPLVSGDSGDPTFLIINGELVLLTVYTYGGAGSGTSITPQISTINAMMTSLGGGYSLTTVDLSSYNTYP